MYCVLSLFPASLRMPLTNRLQIHAQCAMQTYFRSRRAQYATPLSLPLPLQRMHCAVDLHPVDRAGYHSGKAVLSSGVARKLPWDPSYASMSLPVAEEKLKITLPELTRQAISVAEMLAKTGYILEDGNLFLVRIKDRVYNRILDHLEGEGYPLESYMFFRETNINDLVYSIVITIIAEFKRKSGLLNLQLQRGRHVITRKPYYPEYEEAEEEFVVVDQLSVTEEMYVLIIEVKSSSFEEALKHCLLALKDARDNNREGAVYGFVTNGETWRMLSYDGTSFQVTRKFDVLFRGMDRDKLMWMMKFSLVVDCLYVALKNGGVGREVSIFPREVKSGYETKGGRPSQKLMGIVEGHEAVARRVEFGEAAYQEAKDRGGEDWETENRHAKSRGAGNREIENRRTKFREVGAWETENRQAKPQETEDWQAENRQAKFLEGSNRETEDPKAKHQKWDSENMEVNYCNVDHQDANILGDEFQELRDEVHFYHSEDEAEQGENHMMEMKEVVTNTTRASNTDRKRTPKRERN